MMPAMPHIAFHFNVSDKLHYACRFVRKALRHDARLTIVAPMAVLRALSPRLWQQTPHDFLAHAIQGDATELFALAPVVLVEDAALSPHRDILLNLGVQLPHGYEAFARVIEVVSEHDDADRHQARLRWRSYQIAGFAIERKDLTATGTVNDNFRENA